MFGFGYWRAMRLAMAMQITDPQVVANAEKLVEIALNLSKKYGISFDAVYYPLLGAATKLQDIQISKIKSITALPSSSEKCYFHPAVCAVKWREAFVVGEPERVTLCHQCIVDIIRNGMQDCFSFHDLSEIVLSEDLCKP